MRPAPDPGAPPSRIWPFVMATAVGFAAFALYRATLLPGLDLGDTPSFQIMGGSRFPTPRDAYPLYFALAAPFVWWTGGGAAHAMNLASAAEAGVGCALVLLAACELSGSRSAALAAALSVAASYTFWSQAVTTEVYALHVCGVALTLLLALRWQVRPTAARLCAVLAVYAVSFGNHLTMILLLPGLAGFLAFGIPGGWRTLIRPRTLAVALACAAVGAFPYLWNIRTLLVDPSPPEGLVATLRVFWFDVTKGDWRDTMVWQLPRVMAGERMRMFAFDVHQQFGWAILGLAAAGVVALARRAPARLLLLGAWWIATVVFALTYNVGDTHVFLLPAHLVAALLVGPGLAWIAGAAGAAAGPRARGAVAAAALMLVLTRMYGEYPALDRHADRRAEQTLARLTAGLADHRAVLVSDLEWELQNGLTYYAARERPDLAMVPLNEILTYAPVFVGDNTAIGREVLVTERARATLESAFGPALRMTVDPRVPSAALASRLSTFAEGVRYAFCVVKPSNRVPFDRGEVDEALARLTGGSLATVPDGAFVAVVGRVGSPPALVLHGDEPFRRSTRLAGLRVDVRMDSWPAFDTIRRMGFGHVIAGRRHSLIVERGVSVVALDDDGRPLQVEYASGLFRPQARYRVELAR